MTNTYTIDQAGYIAFPLIGQVAARGRTLQQLSGQIAQKLNRAIFATMSPSASIAIARSSSWAKRVGQPGAIRLCTGRDRAERDRRCRRPRRAPTQGAVDVTRKINGQVMTGRVNISSAIIASDTLYVRERLF